MDEQRSIVRRKGRGWGIDRRLLSPKHFKCNMFFLLKPAFLLQDGNSLLPGPGMFSAPKLTFSGPWEAQAALAEWWGTNSQERRLVLGDVFCAVGSLMCWGRQKAWLLGHQAPSPALNISLTGTQSLSLSQCVTRAGHEPGCKSRPILGRGWCTHREGQSLRLQAIGCTAGRTFPAQWVGSTSVLFRRHRRRGCWTPLLPQEAEQVASLSTDHQ